MLTDKQRKQEALNKMIDACLGNDVRIKNAGWAEGHRAVFFHVDSAIELAEIEALRVLLGSKEVYLSPADDEAIRVMYEYVKTFPWEM